MATVSFSFSLRSIVARILKAVMVVLIIPIAAGLLSGIVDQLTLQSVSFMGADHTIHDWVMGGFLSYVACHVLLYRPAPLFRASRQVFSAVAVWLFGSQVTSVENAELPKDPPKGKEGKASQKASAQPAGDPVAQGSTLVAFSPYVVPIYTVLACALGWGLKRWWIGSYTDAPIAVLIGVTLAFHWLMTADELQQQRSRWHIETYLLALSLVFVLTLLLTAAVLPWAVNEFSFLQALADGFRRTQTIYTALFSDLF